LKPRSETIIRAATNHNQIGIVRTEETAPGVYIRSCLVETTKFSCPVSIINTTDNVIEMPTPIPCHPGGHGEKHEGNKHNRNREENLKYHSS